MIKDMGVELVIFFILMGVALGAIIGSAGMSMSYMKEHEDIVEVATVDGYCETRIQLCELNKSQELYKCYSDLDSLISVSGCRQQKTTVKTCNIVQGECSEREQFYWMC